jgi:hypothetical protein
MPRTARLMLSAAAILLAPALGSCSSMWDGANSMQDRFNDMMYDFNPFGTAKKPLPGERRAVFPEGVPGVQQGVPPELMRGNPQAVDAQPQPAPEDAEDRQDASARATGRIRSAGRRGVGADAAAVRRAALRAYRSEHVRAACSTSPRLRGEVEQAAAPSASSPAVLQGDWKPLQ